ncbi:hypothetical protein [Neodiprion abietis nucleopolyhedrovirus]|uniref:Uncharacterized protein n=1 Tax=Neodiprion abietis nucleopolyhedrovirus TaxID=204507 RepID=Q0ZP37_9CBAC|nr:hypothetical protein [Neodiprion abietis nucleopolyhedrovirus]ABC74917.1 unknown [Neodiprion abietis nucleopolyhedrovirus]
MNFVDDIFKTLKTAITHSAGETMFVKECEKYIHIIYEDKELYENYQECLRRIIKNEIDPTILYTHFNVLKNHLTEADFVTVYENFISDKDVNYIIHRMLCSPHENHFSTLYRVLIRHIQRVNMLN